MGCGRRRPFLPASERKIGAIREGVDPAVLKVGAADVPLTAVRSAEQLGRRHQAGQTSIITVEPAAVTSELRRRGWSRDLATNGWKRADLRVQVLEPDHARGLEFDGVVVVEPSPYPENLGRHGVLYTSLTRATQELTVVHSQPLQPALRAPAKSGGKARGAPDWHISCAGGQEVAR